MPQSKFGNFLIDIKYERFVAEEKNKAPEPKIMDLNEAVRKFIGENTILAVGGCLYSRTPMAVIHEIIRQRDRIKNITLCRNLTGFEADLLMAVGLLKKLVTSWCSPGYAWGLSRVLRYFVENGFVEFEEWSHLGIGLRFKAAAMGVPFLPTFSMLGSDLMRRLNLKTINCPYTGEQVVLVPALFPDVAIIHANRADEYGNVQIDGYIHMDKDIAAAAKHVIITVEQVVSSEEIRRNAEKTIIPFFCVDAVVEIPFGAYPSECWNLYEADFNHMAGYQQMVNEHGIEGARRYIEENIISCSSFMEFLNRVGVDKLFDRMRAFRHVLE